FAALAPNLSDEATVLMNLTRMQFSHHFGVVLGKVNLRQPDEQRHHRCVSGWRRGFRRGPVHHPRDTFGIDWARTELSDDFAPFLRQRLALGLNKEDAVEMSQSPRSRKRSMPRAAASRTSTRPSSRACVSMRGSDDNDRTGVGMLRACAEEASD